MSEYGKNITVIADSVQGGQPNGRTTHRERSIKINDKTELVHELLTAIEPLLNGQTPYLDVTIKQSKDARWTMVKKWKIE